MIDGIPMINNDESTNGAAVNPLVTLSATEIESIEILKDASSASHGRKIFLPTFLFFLLRR